MVVRAQVVVVVLREVACERPRALASRRALFMYSYAGAGRVQGDERSFLCVTRRPSPVLEIRTSLSCLTLPRAHRRSPAPFFPSPGVRLSLKTGAQAYTIRPPRRQASLRI